MENDTAVVANYTFRGIEYVVTMNLVSNHSLLVEVEDKLTADQWRGTFDAAYIEDLTHKTGNYKQFPVFTSMLESAVLQNSDSVGLDLLTYADLESLRDRKMVATGAGTKNVVGARSANMNSKRYLILTYTVEFDRIHYPLPLPYMGKPDPRALQENIRQLRQQIKVLKKQVNKDYKNKELENLRKDYNALLQERDEIEAEAVEFRRQVSQSARGGSAKEIRALKDVIRGLEEELVTERTKHQRAASRRSQQCRQLTDELEELRASERNLRVRVKNLTNELAVLQRKPSGRRANTSSTSLGRGDAPGRRSVLCDRSSSRERSRSGAAANDRSRTSERSVGQRATGCQRRGRPSSREQSTERVLPPRGRVRSSSRDSCSSAAGGRYPRFDPTAYVKEKERMKKETGLKIKRNAQRKMSGDRSRTPSMINDRHRTRSRCSSAGSARSRVSSIESLSDIGIASDVSKHSNHSRASRRRQQSNGWSSPDTSRTKSTSRTKTHKIMVSTPDDAPRTRRLRDKENVHEDTIEGDNKYADRSADLSEIDARLNRLQQFMKANLP